MTVTAWVDGHRCGQAQTQMQTLGGQPRLTFVIKILAEDGSSAAGCGLPGRQVRFEVGGRMMATNTTWNNDQVTRWELRP